MKTIKNNFQGKDKHEKYPCGYPLRQVQLSPICLTFLSFTWCPPNNTLFSSQNTPIEFIKKNSAYGRQSISRPMPIVAPIPKKSC